MKRCAICGSTGKLTTHHIYYEPEVTVEVCWECHKKIHTNPDKFFWITPRQKPPYKKRIVEILASSEEGMSSDEIAKKLGIDVRRVRNYLKALYGRFVYRSKNYVYYLYDFVKSNCVGCEYLESCINKPFKRGTVLCKKRNERIIVDEELANGKEINEVVSKVEPQIIIMFY